MKEKGILDESYSYYGGGKSILIVKKENNMDSCKKVPVYEIEVDGVDRKLCAEHTREVTALIALGTLEGGEMNNLEYWESMENSCEFHEIEMDKTEVML